MANDNTDWVKFFKECGIPSSLAAKYAVTFNNHRIQLNMLRDLNKEILYDMGIKTIGDVIAILRHAKEVDEEAEKVHVLGARHSTPVVAAAPALTTKPKPVVNEKPSLNKAVKRSVPDDTEESGSKIRRSSGDDSVEYTSRGSTYVIKMPIAYTQTNPTPKAALNQPPSKGSIFARLGAATTKEHNKITFEPSKETKSSTLTIAQSPLSSSSSSPLTSSSSVFARLGGGSTSSAIMPSGSIIRKSASNETSVLRGAEGASKLFGGKVTATVKPTNLLIRKTGNERDTIGQTVNMASMNRLTIKNRIGVTSKSAGDQVLNSLRSLNMTKKVINEPARPKQTISLKKSVFDRLGPSRP